MRLKRPLIAADAWVGGVLDSYTRRCAINRLAPRHNDVAHKHLHVAEMNSYQLCYCNVMGTQAQTHTSGEENLGSDSPTETRPPI